MATRRKGRTPHVTLVKPSKSNRTKRWRARITDPDTGDFKWVPLPDDVTNAEAREKWAKAKSKEIALRLEEIESGKPRATGKSINETIEAFFESHAELSPKTVETLRGPTSRFVAWCERNGVRTADHLTRPKLKRFRAYVVALPKRQSAEGVKQGGKVITQTRRSPTSINNDLRNVGRVLRDLIDEDAFCKLAFDDVRRSLKPVKTERKLKHFLKPAEIRQMIEAAQRHDADTFTMTREEKDSGKKGETLRYDPIASFLLFTLLSGARLGEVLDLQWKNVHLDAMDVQGRRVGEVRILAPKTGHERSVWLEVSPALRQLLIALKLRTGGKGRVFASITRDGAIKAMRRMKADCGAPAEAGWQACRRTASTFLINSPGIPMGLFEAARQLGHSAVIAEKNYANLLRGVDPEHRTLESAMQIEDLCTQIVESVQTRRAA